MNDKTIQVTLKLHTGRSNFDICEAIEQVLLNSSMNNSELKLEIQEVKVIGDKIMDGPNVQNTNQTLET